MQILICTGNIKAIVKDPCKKYRQNMLSGAVCGESRMHGSKQEARGIIATVDLTT
jgi:hypothetical protein